MEEPTGRKRQVIKLFTSIMPKFNYHVRTGCSISEESHKGSAELASTGQGNKFSGDICCNISSLIICQLEKKKLGVALQSMVLKLVELCLSIFFV